MFIDEWCWYSCPVCGQILANLGTVAQQEDHVKACLDGGTGKSPQTSKYLVYKLPGESALIGTECECIFICDLVQVRFVTGVSVRRCDLLGRILEGLYCRSPELLVQLPQW